jgi:hypothetical protein
MTDQLDKWRGVALCARLRSEGKMIASTVVPKEWVPTDPQLDQDAKEAERWSTK